MQVVDRTAARERLLSQYQDPTTPPFPGAVAMSCNECGSFIRWTNPPLPSTGQTICRDCSE